MTLASQPRKTEEDDDDDDEGVLLRISKPFASEDYEWTMAVGASIVDPFRCCREFVAVGTGEIMV